MIFSYAFYIEKVSCYSLLLHLYRVLYSTIVDPNLNCISVKIVGPGIG